MTGRLVAGLANAWVQPQVADQVPCAGEARDVADHGDQRDGGGHVDAGDGQQAPHVLVALRLGRDEAIDLGEFLAEEVELAQAALDGETLIRRQFLDGEPSATLTAEEVAHRRASPEVALQHRRDLVLDLRAALDEALGLVGLADRSNDRVETFSKGMQQRLGLGVALLGQPELVVLDEPTSALDPVGRQDVREIIRSLRDRGVTVFLNSHLLTEVERVCDRVAIVDKGRVVAELAMSEVRRESGVGIRAAGLDPAAIELAGQYGPARFDGEWLTVDGIAEDRVPALVAQLVAAGAAIHAVMPSRSTLEERFLALLGTEEPTGPAEPPGSRKDDP